MQSLLCAGTIWGGIQQPSWIAQSIAAPVQPPTSMILMFLSVLCLIYGLCVICDVYVISVMIFVMYM
jgi:hypothetical protein